jgi:hypothetical protein
MTRLTTLVAAALLGATALPAQQTTYTDRASFMAALQPGTTTITFDNIVQAPFNNAQLPGQIGNATFSAPTPWLPNPTWTVFGYANPYYSLSSYPNLMVASSGGPFGINVDFGGSVTAFGIDYATPWGGGGADNFMFVLYNGSTPFYSVFRLASAVAPNSDFVGITSTQPFTSVAITSSGIGLFDNLTYGQLTPPPVTSTPEPASFALLAPGLAALAAARRRRARA